MIEVHEYNDLGYSKLMHYQNWRVAMLNYTPELSIENINYFQKHDYSDEVFVLLDGNCTLFICEENNGDLVNLKAIKMKKNKAYNILKGVYHTHALEPNSKVLVIENEDTCDENSPIIYFNHDISRQLQNLLQK